MYINEKPVTQAQVDANTLPIVVISDQVLDESILIYNGLFGTALTDISQVPVLIQDYLVKRAARSLFTRKIGFDDKGLEVIIVDERMALKSVAKSVFDTVLGVGTYKDISLDAVTVLASRDSIEDVHLFATHIKTQIDSIVSSVTDIYAFMVGNQALIEYAGYKVMADSVLENREIAFKKSMDLLTTVAGIVYDGLVSNGIANVYVQRVLQEIPIDKQNIRSASDIATNVSKVTSILENSKKEILSYGWYFNTTTMYLTPNTDKYIIIPTTFLSVDGSSDSDTYTVRDWKLFDNGTMTFLFDNPVECIVIEDISFDDLSSVMYKYIHSYALLESYKAICGVDDKVSMYVRKVQETKADALRDDAANSDGNLLTSTYSTTQLDRTSI